MHIQIKVTHSEAQCFEEIIGTVLTKSNEYPQTPESVLIYSTLVPIGQRVSTALCTTWKKTRPIRIKHQEAAAFVLFWKNRTAQAPPLTLIFFQNFMSTIKAAWQF